MRKANIARLTLAFALTFAVTNAAYAQNFAFATHAAQLVIQPNAVASSLTDRHDGMEELHPAGLPFAVVTQHGKQFPATRFERHGALFHVTFGSSGISADYRITASAEYIVVELAAVQGEGIEKLELMQVSTGLANSGGTLLGVRWDDKFAICLMGLDQEVNTAISGSMISASVYPEFGMQGRRVAIIAEPTQQFLSVIQNVESDFRLFSPAPTIDGVWAKLSPDASSNYLLTDLTEANVDDTIRYAKLGGFRYILIYARTWSTSFGSYRINTVNFPHREAGLKFVIDKCHAAGLKVGMHMMTSFIEKDDPLALAEPDIGLLKDVDGAPVLIDGSYVADLRLPLADAITNRIANVINQVGFDMIYFDAGFNTQNPTWYWGGIQQSQIWKRTRGNLLVQGSGITDWTWHIFTRGVCDDFAAVAVKQYLDYHKIPDYWRPNHNAFMPSDLGWVGLLQDSPDHPATTPDEVEYYAVRMLALDSAISFETTLSALKANGRTQEMLNLLNAYEQLKQSGAVPAAVRKRLVQGEWHMTTPGEFHPIRYDPQLLTAPGEVIVRNTFQEQPLKFRLQVMPALASTSNSANIPLLRTKEPLEVEPPGEKDAMPGALVGRIELNRFKQDQESVWFVGPTGHALTQGFDLTAHRALAVRLTVEGPEQNAAESPVLNFQLEAGGKTYRDYYIDLNFRGSKTVLVPEPGTDRMLAEFRPAYSNYRFKAAMYRFNYANIVALNLRWMRYPMGSGVRCRVDSVEALAERNSGLKDLEISAGQASLSIPGEMKTGDYAEFWGDGPIRVFDRNGFLLRTVSADRSPVLVEGETRLAVKASGTGSVKLTAITMGSSSLR
ncbi:MAG: hypothetical protein WBE76_05975 [Terracidiphilus sp.]